MDYSECIKTISGVVEEYLSHGLIPDVELYHFINSSYGLTNRDDIIEFISNGHDSGAVIDLLSYPSDTLRKSVERIIPDKGIPSDMLKDLIEVRAFNSRYFIILDEKKIILSQMDSLFCIEKIIQRLNLHVNVASLSDLKEALTDIDIYDVRIMLRKRKFISGDACARFIRDLVAGCNSMERKNTDEFFNLVDTACGLLNNSDGSPQEILLLKSEYYKNAYMEALEFTNLLKTYSMEFVMMRKIQPPLITAEEALSMLEIISRISSIASRGINIPSVIFTDE